MSLSNLSQRIDLFSKYAYIGTPRGYLGVSGVGYECRRKTFLDWRFAAFPCFSGRQLRLFNRGHREEAVIVDMLRGAGYRTQDVDPQTGRQFEVLLHDGHVKGHCDGFVWLRKKHLLEIKTANKANWTRCSKISNLQVFNEAYYVQVQLYMHFFKVKQTLWICVNKDNDAIYYEIVKLDKGTVDLYLRVLQDLVEQNCVPLGVSQTADYYKCRCCPYLDYCFHGAKFPNPACKNCRNIVRAGGGSWQCNGKEVSIKDLRSKTCLKYAELKG